MTRAYLVGVLLLLPTLGPAQTADIPRTAWGAPDLSGYWEYSATTPLERPEALADTAVLTPEEEAAYLTQRHEAIGHERDLQLNADWWQPGGLTDGRTALIVDPANGRLPTPTVSARRRMQALGMLSRLRPADGPEDRERYERCIMGRTVPMMAVSPNRLAQIFQTPEYLVVLHEQNSDLRIIPIGAAPLDERPRLPEAIRQWQGASRGHWEDDTLVIETTQLNGKWTLQGESRHVRFVERIAIADGASRLDYEFTVDDAESFAAPWTVAFPITRADGPLYENACHEGNHSMPLILRGARAQEQAEETSSSNASASF